MVDLKLAAVENRSVHDEDITDGRIDAAAYQAALETKHRLAEQSVLTLVQSQTNRYADAVALFQALSGGWWNRDPR